MTTSSVQNRPASKSHVSDALSSGLSRAVATAGGKGACADRMEVEPKTLSRWLGGETMPELHLAAGALSVDRTALNDVLALYGLTATPKVAEAANDMALVGALSNSVTEFLRLIADGKRCHIDTAVLATLFRPLIPQMQSIVDEHDKRVAA